MVDTKLSQLLGFDAHGSFVKTIEVKNFGKDIIITCLHSPWENPSLFYIDLVDCKDIRWVVFLESFDPPGSESELGADIIGLEIGNSDYDKVFLVHTVVFELSVSYRNLQVRKNN
ncbi:MAG: hypothetical protein ABI690_19445 [Chloroflexota bacterium]